jgi:hypothetical protein
MSVPFKLAHDVYQVLQDSRPSNPTVFRDVTDEDDWKIELLSHVD